MAVAIGAERDSPPVRRPEVLSCVLHQQPRRPGAAEQKGLCPPVEIAPRDLPAGRCSGTAARGYSSCDEAGPRAATGRRPSCFLDARRRSPAGDQHRPEQANRDGRPSRHRRVARARRRRDLPPERQRGVHAETAGAHLAEPLSAAIRDATGLDVPVVTRTGAELARVVEANPYSVDDPTKVVVAFLADALDLGDLALGDLSSYLPDELTISGRELYVSVPNGQGRSKLMEALTKRSLPTTLTVRNWRTVEALAEMAR